MKVWRESAEIAAIRKVDEALALQKVDGQSVLYLRRPVARESSGNYVYILRDAEGNPIF